MKARLLLERKSAPGGVCSSEGLLPGRFSLKVKSTLGGLHLSVSASEGSAYGGGHNAHTKG